MVRGTAQLGKIFRSTRAAQWPPACRVAWRHCMGESTLIYRTHGNDTPTLQVLQRNPGKNTALALSGFPKQSKIISLSQHESRHLPVIAKHETMPCRKCPLS